MANTIISVIVMIAASIVGLFAGAFVNDFAGGAILFALIAGIACIIHTIDKKETK